MKPDLASFTIKRHREIYDQEMEMGPKELFWGCYRCPKNKRFGHLNPLLEIPGPVAQVEQPMVIQIVAIGSLPGPMMFGDSSPTKYSGHLDFGSELELVHPITASNKRHLLFLPRAYRT